MRVAVLGMTVLLAGCVTARVPIDTWNQLQQVPGQERANIGIPAVRVRDGRPIYVRASEAITDTSGEPEAEGTRTVEVANGKLTIGILLAGVSAAFLISGAVVYATPDPQPCSASLFCGSMDRLVGGALMGIGVAVGAGSMVLSILGGVYRKTRVRPQTADPKQMVRW
jgi:hypothetical protein